MDGVSSKADDVWSVVATVGEDGTCVGMVGSGTGIGVSLDEVSPDGVSSTGMGGGATAVAVMDRDDVLPTAALALLVPSKDWALSLILLCFEGTPPFFLFMTSTAPGGKEVQGGHKF